MSTVCVHGLGYIGLPTAAVLADAGHDVIGYDVDDSVREVVRGGESHLDEPELDDLVRLTREAGTLTVAEAIPAADYHLVCVPTPFDADRREANLEYVRAAARGAGEALRAGDTVILESTVPPGTTTGPLLAELAESSELEPGADFSVAHCPETVLPGRMLAELRTNDRLVGGIDADSTRRARRLYESFVEGDVDAASDPTTAEFVKLVQNTYRDVNVALANEVAQLAADYDVVSREAIAAANRHPRVDLLRPGPGVGGHCLPVDPWFLGHESDRLDLVRRARAVNDAMPGYVVDLVADSLGSLDGRRVAVLGVAYKGNVDDTRGSPGLALADELRARADVDVPLHDVRVSDSSIGIEKTVVGATRDADALVVAAAHDEYASLAPGCVVNRMSDDVVVDACDGLDRDRWRSVGATVESL